MITTEIKDNEKKALTEYVQRGDANMDPSQADAWASDGSFTIGSFPTQVGPEQIEGFLGGFFTMGLFNRLEHRMIEVLEDVDRVVFQGVAIYTLDDDETLEIPYVNWVTYTREESKLKFKSYRVFIDTKPLMDRAPTR